MCSISSVGRCGNAMNWVLLVVIGLVLIVKQSTNVRVVCGGKWAGIPMHVDDALTMLGLVHASIGYAQCTVGNATELQASTVRCLWY
jgi:hypothetical protein